MAPMIAQRGVKLKLKLMIDDQNSVLSKFVSDHVLASFVALIHLDAASG